MKPFGAKLQIRGPARTSCRGLSASTLLVVTLLAGCAPPAETAGSGSAPAIDPAAEMLPPPDREEAADTLAFLSGEGALLQRFAGDSNAVAESTVSADRCREEAARLNSSYSAKEILELATQVSDEVLRSIFLSLRTSTLAMLSGCIQGEDLVRDQQAIRRLTDLVRDRVDQLREAAP